MADKNYNSLLKKLIELHSCCETLNGFSPIQELIKHESLKEKISRIEKLNFGIIQLESGLNMKRQLRIRKIKGLSEKHGINGIIRLSRQAVNYVGAFGKDYNYEQQMLKNLICRMQPKGGQLNGDQGGIPQSYEAITNAAEQFYLILKELPLYEPADHNISKKNFKEKVEEIKLISAEINELYEQVRPMIKQRYEEYHSKEIGIRKVFTEVKKYVRGNWGINSNEYKSIKDHKI